MPKIALLTSRSLPVPDNEMPLIEQAFAARGFDSTVMAWDDPALPRCGADAALIRSTWDYTHRLDDFLDTLTHLPMPVLNAPEVVRQNAHKVYLVDLATAGVPTVPTWLIRRGSGVALPDAGAPEVIVKPAVSAGARGVGRFVNESEDAAEHLRQLSTGVDVLVQPFLPDVADGERSLLFFGGTYSHAVVKRPANGDFRVQEQYGGESHSIIAADSDRDIAAQALKTLDPDNNLAYARVDLVGGADRPMVMEVELIEPSLFLWLAPGSPDRLVSAVAERI